LKAGTAMAKVLASSKSIHKSNQINYFSNQGVAENNSIGNIQYQVMSGQTNIL